jgi:hypothetical protein
LALTTSKIVEADITNSRSLAAGVSRNTTSLTSLDAINISKTSPETKSLAPLKPFNQFTENLNSTDPCQRIRDWVLTSASKLQADSTGKRFSTPFDMLWDIEGFLHDQYKERPGSIGNVITLSGSASHAQASTCRDYVQLRWSTYGPRVIDKIQAALDYLGWWTMGP